MKDNEGKNETGKREGDKDRKKAQEGARLREQGEPCPTIPG